MNADRDRSEQPDTKMHGDERRKTYRAALRNGDFELSWQKASWLASVVMAVADAEQAELRSEVERLRFSPDHIEELLGIDPNDPLHKLAQALVNEQAKVARVEAAMRCAANQCHCGGDRGAVPTREIRAALDGATDA